MGAYLSVTFGEGAHGRIYDSLRNMKVIFHLVVPQLVIYANQYLLWKW